MHKNKNLNALLPLSPVDTSYNLACIEFDDNFHSVFTLEKVSRSSFLNSDNFIKQMVHDQMLGFWPLSMFNVLFDGMIILKNSGCHRNSGFGLHDCQKRQLLKEVWIL